MPKKYSPISGKKFVNLKTKEIEQPQSGSLIGLRLFSTLSSATSDAETDQGELNLGNSSQSFATRKSGWPEGRSEDGNFSYATFRAISETIVNSGSWFPVDFSKKGILKKATAFLISKPFMKDHSRRMDMQIGSITDTVYDKRPEGDAMPSGINALVRINANVPAAENVVPLVEAGDAKSVSVTIFFEWEKSHPDLENWQFWDLIGTEIEGHEVRAIVTKVVEISELSQVWDGADPFAERIAASKDGSQSFQSYATGILDADELDELQTNAPDGLVQENNQDEEITMNEFQKALAHLFGIDVEDVTEEFAKDVIVGSKSLAETEFAKTLVASKQTKVDEYADLLEERNTEIADLKAAAEKSTDLVALGETYVKSVRDDAVRLYKLSNDGEGDATIVAMIEEATLERALALQTQFKKTADSETPLKCGKCGSEEVSRAVSSNTSEDDAEGGDAGNDGEQELSSDDQIHV